MNIGMEFSLYRLMDTRLLGYDEDGGCTLLMPTYVEFWQRDLTLMECNELTTGEARYCV